MSFPILLFVHNSRVVTVFIGFVAWEIDWWVEIYNQIEQLQDKKFNIYVYHFSSEIQQSTLYMKYNIEHINNTQIQYETFIVKDNTSCQIAHEK